MWFADRKFLLILLAGFSFGSSIVMARYALREIDPYPLTVLRFAVASAIYLAVLVIWKKSIPKNWRTIKDMSLVGFFGTGLTLLVLILALQYISSAMLALFLATLPIFTALMAHLFLSDEKLNKKIVAGLLISLSGVAYMVITKTSGLSDSFNLLGPVLAFAGIIMAAGGGVYARSRLKMEDAFVVSAVQTFAALGILIIIVGLLGKLHVENVSLAAWGAVAYNGIIGSFIAFWATFELIKRYGATASALSGYVMPIVSAILGTILLGELISITLIIGASIVLAGLTLVVKQPKSHVGVK